MAGERRSLFWALHWIRHGRPTRSCATLWTWSGSVCRRTTAARALHPSLSLEIAEAHLGKDHLDLIVGARYLVVGGDLTRRRTMTRLLSYSDGGANRFDTVGLLLQELSAQQLRQRGARASGHVKLRTSRRCSTQPRSSAWTASLWSKPRSSARCPQRCSSNTMELHAVKVVPAYGDGHGLCSEA